MHSEQNVDARPYQKHLGAMKALESFTPSVRPEEWADVASFARDAAVVTAEATRREPLPLLKTVASYLVWCVFEQGLDLEASAVFQVDFIEEYCQQWSPRTAASYRSTLMAFRHTLAPVTDPVCLIPLPRSAIQPPYTPGQILTFRTWAHAQHTALRRRRSKLLLALGAGAGLRSGELMTVRGRDVLIDTAGVVVTVHGTAGRDVPVLSLWESWVAEAAEDTKPDSYLWRPGTGRIRKNTLWAFTSGSNGPAPSVVRLRANWLLTHLFAGTPMKELFKAGGIDKFDNLPQYLAHIEPASDREYRRMLRREALR